MRKKLLALLSMVMTVALALALSVSSAFATSDPVDFAKDSTKWLNLTGANVTEDGIKTTAAVYNAATVAVGGNSTIEVVEDSYLASGGWGYHSVMVKVNDSSAYAWNPEQTTSSGNWLAIAVKHSSPAFAIYESVDGVVSVVAEATGVSGYDNWYAFNQKNVFTISLEDVADGVKITASFTPSDCRQGSSNTGNTYTLSYKSTNLTLWGEGSVVVGRYGGGTASDTEYANINVNVTDVDSDFVYTPPTPVEISKDSTAWSKLTNVTVSDSGMYQTSNSFNATTKAIGGDSTIDVIMDATSYTSTSGWEHDWIVFKSNGTILDPSTISDESTGNWLALRWGSSTARLYMVECVDGVVTKTSLCSNGADVNYGRNQKTQITITTKDTDSGVNVAVHYEVLESNRSDANFTTGGFDYTYVSSNTKLWGEQYVVVGHRGNMSVTDEARFELTVNVTDVDSNYEYPPDYAKDSTKWESITGATVTTEGLVTNATTVRVSSVAIGGNSTIDVTMSSPSTTGTWQYEWIMLKASTPDTSWVPAASKDTVASSTSDWLAIAFGGSCGNFFFVESKDGVVTQTPKYSISNYAHWYSDEQTTKIVLTTVDTEDGVTLNVTFTQSDCSNSNAPNTSYDVSYSSTSKKLWGEQKVLIGHSGDNKNAITYNVKVDDVASEYSYDNYLASEVSALIAQLSTDVDEDNLVDMTAKYESAKSAYDALTDAQKALIEASEVEAMEDCKAKLDEVAREVAIASLPDKIDALPTEITIDNYSTAKSAIEEAETLYNSLTDNEKANISNASVLVEMSAKLDAFEADMSVASVVVEAIDALPTEISRVNYNQELVSSINAVVDAYDVLTDAQKLHVNNSQKLTAVVDALELYEESLAEPDYDETNLAQDEDNWSRYGNVNASNVSFSNYGMALEGSYNAHKAMLLKSNVKADSTITVRFDGLTTTSWGQSYVMFKMMDDADSINAGNAITAFDWGGNAGAPQGTWMTLMFGNSSALYFAYCIDGEVVKIVDTTVPSTEFNKAHTQITDITIVTEDTQTGVNVTITFKASGIAGITGETYTLNYTVESTAFHGAHGVAVGTYNGSLAGEEIVVTDFRISHDSGSALVARSFGNEVNFASDRKYWKAGNNMAGFEFGENGASLWDAKTGGLLLNQVVQNEDIVKVTLDGTLPITTSSYGNVYFILRSKEAQLRLNGSHFPEVSGNYVILQIGADGIKIFECANGTMLHDAQLLPSGAVQGGYDLSEGTNGNDIWYVYGNYSAFEFYSEDVDGGVDFYITFKAPSGKTYNFEYFSENEALQGDSYFGIEYFLYANGSSEGLMTLETLRIDGVTEGFVPNVDVADLNSKLVALASTALTVDNVDDVRAKYNEYKSLYETLNYDMLKEFNKNALDSVLANIVAFDNEINDVDAIIDDIDDLPTEVTADNYSQAVSAYNSVKSAYDMLSPYGKTLVTNKSKLDALASAIEAYDINVDAAAAFDALVDAIPALGEDNTAEVETAVQLAESSYDALTDAQKAMTTKYDTLVSIRASLDAQKGNEGGESGGCAGGFASAPFFALAALVAIRRLKKRA